MLKINGYAGIPDVPTDLFIKGKWLPSKSGRRLEVTSARGTSEIQAAVFSIGENDRPRLSATALYVRRPR
jgi:hypothetical protein